MIKKMDGTCGELFEPFFDFCTERIVFLVCQFCKLGIHLDHSLEYSGARIHGVGFAI